MSRYRKNCFCRKECSLSFVSRFLGLKVLLDSLSWARKKPFCAELQNTRPRAIVPRAQIPLCNNFRYGADVGFTGRRTARFSRNLPTILSQPGIVSENLSKEVALGRVAGPFPSPPLPNFQVSPIGLVPKKHSAKFRTIFHLSFPKSGDTSINSSIPKEDLSLQYTTIDNAIKAILGLGQECFLAKTDIESAFRLIPLRPSDYELFGMYWEDKKKQKAHHVSYFPTYIFRSSKPLNNNRNLSA